MKNAVVHDVRDCRWVDVVGCSGLLCNCKLHANIKNETCDEKFGFHSKYKTYVHI